MFQCLRNDESAEIGTFFPVYFLLYDTERFNVNKMAVRLVFAWLHVRMRTTPQHAARGAGIEISEIVR